jgi:ankyrin repeat protein
MLLDRGADVNAQSGRSGNALQAALFERHEETAVILLDRGADISGAGCFGINIQLFTLDEALGWCNYSH